MPSAGNPSCATRSSKSRIRDAGRVTMGSKAQFAGVLLAVALLSDPSRAGRDASSPPDKPPVVLITVDTLRSDRLTSYGYDKGRTPASDLLARDGVLFENAYVQTPITLPSHATILTGTYPMYHKVQDVVGRLRDGLPTLATVLKNAGYATGAFVGSTVLSARWNLNRGFDVYDDRFQVREGLRQVDFDRLERSADDVLAPARKWLEVSARGPFFLWIHIYDPHDPYTPPAPFDTDFRDRPYDGEIAYAEAALLKLLEGLRASGLYEKALVVYTSDHGESLGEHQELHHGYFVYEASLRVPLIIKLPENRYKGTRLPNTVRSLDIAPTLLQVLGVPYPESFQGESLLAMMARKREGTNLTVYAESYYPQIHFNWSPLFSLRLGRFKYIEAPVPELYDLQIDPGETANVYQTNQAVAGQLKNDLRTLQERYRAGTGGSASDAAQQVDSETIERLKSLGYIAFSSASNRDGDNLKLPDPKAKIKVYNLLNQGIALSRRGQSDKALETFARVAQTDPTMPIVHFLMGLQYFEKGWHLKAIEEFQTTLTHNPDSNVARFNLARAYLESGQTEKAEEVFKLLVEQEPSNFGARHYLSLCYARRSRYEDAAAMEAEALKLRPEFVEGHNNLGSYYLRLQQVDRAVASYNRALELAPGFLMARLNLALAYLRQGAYDDALRESKAVAEADPKQSLAHYYMGQAYLAKGARQEAREAFQKAKQLDPRLNVPPM